MSSINVRNSLENTSYKQIAVAFTLCAGALYIISKLLASFVPGEPNTVLLATPCSNTGNVSTELDDATEYDYVIIGGGTAGCVLANRLSEDPNVTVLVIEAGHSDLKQIFSRIPAGFGKLFGTAADWNYYTAKDRGCNDRKLFWPRGKMLGVCSAINAMIHYKGSSEDYDEWEKLGNPGWGFTSVQKHATKAEAFQQSPRSTLTATDLADHGRSGPWQVGYSHMSAWSKTFLDACAAVGIPKISDFNSRKGMLGASPFQTFIDTQGQRSSTAVAYLTKDVASRPNLSLAVGQTVTKIISETWSNLRRAVGLR